MVLPVVAMIIALILGSLAVQLERMKLVSIAATVSRAVARGEPLDKLAELIGRRKLEFKNTPELICAELSAGFTLPGLAGLVLPISDSECSRRLGL